MVQKKGTAIKVGFCAFVKTLLSVAVVVCVVNLVPNLTEWKSQKLQRSLSAIIVESGGGQGRRDP